MAKAKETPAQETTEQTTAKKATGPTALTKISAASVYGKIKISAIPEEGELAIMRIAGIASGTKSGQSTYGEWFSLTGQMAATNAATGEIFIGSNAFVPGAMGDALVNALETAQKEDARATLKFSLDISVKRSPRNPEEKYEYIVRPVIESDVKNEALLLLSL
jgi:hypothetical protein